MRHGLVSAILHFDVLEIVAKLSLFLFKSSGKIVLDVGHFDFDASLDLDVDHSLDRLTKVLWDLLFVLKEVLLISQLPYGRLHLLLGRHL